MLDILIYFLELEQATGRLDETRKGVMLKLAVLREQILQTDIVHKQLSKHLFDPIGGC